MNLIKIKHKGSKDGWALVNEADFDSKKHELFEGQPKRARNKKGQLIADKKKASTKKG